jgi:hypothetical protein
MTSPDRINRYTHTIHFLIGTRLQGWCLQAKSAPFSKGGGFDALTKAMGNRSPLAANSRAVKVTWRQWDRLQKGELHLTLVFNVEVTVSKEDQKYKTSSRVQVARRSMFRKLSSAFSFAGSATVR